MTMYVVGSARRWFPGLLFLLLLPGCSPVFNWRDVTVTDNLLALLPCKPDRATRNLEVPGIERISISMTGCPAGDATFAIAQAEAGSAEQAAMWLAAWKASTRAQWPDAQLTETVATVAGADEASASRFTITRAAEEAARKASVQSGSAEIVWFTNAVDGTHVTVYQAIVLGKPSAVDATSTFFEGVRLSARRSPA
ncbi:hypothetical protein QN397_13645 [Variovorax sp. RTB1]|uniref:hypothetical protein n=1 Tax=Variovorax sp. RTB1 TaxID=3048631 RepID=UPI002B232362|nr:hypothetical protein [Variovorax sp. RTB1]MEB0112399.1 hypothetical protein [Variovorax sp. RTB1]